MTLTNEHGLPEPLVAAIRNDEYSRGDSDISVTELIGPPRIRQLRLKHETHMSEDASERLWSLIGKIGHKILQHGAGDGAHRGELEYVRTVLSRALVLLDDAKESQLFDLIDAAYKSVDVLLPEQSAGALVEHRFFMEREGMRISGQVDYLPATREIDDYKFTSYHTAKNGPKPEWIEQLNTYRLLAHVNGVTVNKLRIIAIYRDWSKMAAQRSQHDYPQAQVHVFNLPVWSIEDAEQFVVGRVMLHKAAAAILPECNADERWEKPARFALMQKGRKRAIKLYDTEAEATAAITNPKHQHVEDRPGEWVRCENYCPVAPYCSQFRDYMADKHL